MAVPLPTDITSGQDGHLGWHEEIHDIINQLGTIPTGVVTIGGDQEVTGLKEFTSGFYVGDDTTTFVGPQAFPNGNGLQFLAMDDEGSVGHVLIPGVNVDESLMSTQTIWYGKTGDDYNRFAISNVGNGVIIDETYNGAGTPRPVAFYMDGSVSNAKAGIEMIRLNINGELMLNGGAPTIDGTAYSGRTYIADRYDTGSVKLRIGTRTVSAVSNTADSAVIDFERANVRRGGFGLNYNGDNIDSFDLVTSAAARLVQFRQDAISIFGSTTTATPEIRISGSTSTNNKLTFYKNGVERGFVAHEDAAGQLNLALDSDGNVVVRGGNAERARFLDSTPGTDLTGMSLQTNNGGSTSVRQVRVGAADSGGSGFRALIVAN